MTVVFSAGYEVFGCTGDEEPFSRRREGMAEWETAEMHGGISLITINSHGDNIGGVFVKVYGLDERACRVAWRRTIGMWSAQFGEIWP